MASLTIFCTLALEAVLREVAPQFEREHGATLDLRFGPTALLVERIEAGETADVAILTESALDALGDAGILSKTDRTPVVRSHVGVAVRKGAAHPDISTVEAFRALLLSGRSICYSQAGASGLFFKSLIEQWNIAERVNSTAKVIPNGYTAAAVASGETELAVQQVSELLTVSGIEVVGRLPAEIGPVTAFPAACFAASPSIGPARALLKFLRSPAVLPAIEAQGLEAA
jgi:molybdate transport system substrate-binding protein